jgi:hypothetical protein
VRASAGSRTLEGQLTAMDLDRIVIDDVDAVALAHLQRLVEAPRAP